MKVIARTTLILLSVLLVSGCGAVQESGRIIFENAPPKPVEIPVNMQDLLTTWQDLGLPDLSNLADLPSIDSLPLVENLPGGIVYRGPHQRKIAVGERIPGTDIVLVRTTDEGAEFEIASMRSLRVVGDSLDFDGEWPGLSGSTYNSRMRIYRVSNNNVRIAGVHQLAIPDISPVQTDQPVPSNSLEFPFVTHVNTGDTIPGTTYGYVGLTERGAELFGISAGVYPYRKVGDSIQWRGNLRADVSVEYNIRAIHFDESAMQVGGIVSVRLPQ